MVLGMDWLAACSPMVVDWAAKVMQFDHQGALITLTGVHTKLTTCSVVSPQ